MSHIDIIRYKKDLRIQDHAPLCHAIKQSQHYNRPLIALYVREPSIMNYPDYSNLHQYRIQQSLKDLSSSLKKLNIPLLMMYNEMIFTLELIQQYYSIHTIRAHEEIGNGLTFQRDKDVIQYCKNNSIIFTEYPTNGIVRRLKNRDERDTIRKQRIQEPIIAIPFTISPHLIDEKLINTTKASMQEFLPATKPAARTYQRELPGETQAHIRLQKFLSDSQHYIFSVSKPERAIEYSGRISAYLAFGNISLKQVYRASQYKLSQLIALKEQEVNDEAKKKIGSHIRSLRAFVSRLHRHSHFIQKLESLPSLEYHNQNSGFNSIRSIPDQRLIHLREQGQTGIPMVDAGMRCLSATGWINFRMRAMLVSFICNTCLQPWQSIAHYLARVFMDYEPGIHYSQIQMQASTTGINTVRIYNPIKQLEDKDHEGGFIRKWIPELTPLSDQELLLLGTQSGNQLLVAKNVPYPPACIDIEQANRTARALLYATMRSPEVREQAAIIYQKIGSRKRPTPHKRKTAKKKDTPKAKSLFDL